jgi:hypothetical protein
MFMMDPIIEELLVKNEIVNCVFILPANNLLGEIKPDGRIIEEIEEVINKYREK